MTEQGKNEFLRFMEGHHPKMKTVHAIFEKYNALIKKQST
jgi:hypothetical protein